MVLKCLPYNAYLLQGENKSDYAVGKSAYTEGCSMCLQCDTLKRMHFLRSIPIWKAYFQSNHKETWDKAKMENVLLTKGEQHFSVS